jgi:hypothetical protein
LKPRTWNAIVKIIGLDLTVHYDLLQPLSSFDVTSLILIGILLNKCHDEGGDGKSHTHIWVVHEGDDSFGPF